MIHSVRTYPLLQSQLGVFLECLRYPDCTQYNLPTCTPLGREVDIDRLEEAFNVIYKSRIAWRIRFGLDENGTPYQYADDTKVFRVIRREMNDDDLQKYVLHGFCKPFNLMGDEPLLRVEIVRTEKQDYMLIDPHHLIMDGISFSPIFTHIDLTNAFRDASLSPETYTMLDAAIDEQKSFAGEDYRSAKEYYAAKFEDVGFATLSSHQDSPVGQMLRVHEYVGKKKVDEWCQTHGVAANLLFQAAFSYVMSVLLREDRIAYTTVSHGRFDRRWRDISGMFSRRVPILSELKDGQTVLDYIKGFRSELMSTIRYSSYPISHLCSDLHKELGANFNFFAMSDINESIVIGGQSYRGFQQLRMTANTDLSVEIYLYKGSYDIRVDSSEALNGLETLQMVARAMAVTLREMMSHPNAPIKSLSIVSSEEEQILMELGTGETLDYDRTKTFVDLFREQAARTPDAVAVVDGYAGLPGGRESSLSYRELDEASDEYAKTVTPGTFVCLEMPRVKEFVVAVLGIWKAGSAYVPIDTEYPEERKKFMREECDGKPLPHPDIAYMIYTSGSTGKPKGVMTGHKGLTNYIHSTTVINGLLPSDKISAYRSFSFDSHIEEFYPTLSIGATVYIIPESIRSDLNLLRDFLNIRNINGCYFPTSVAVLLYNSYDLNVRFMGAVGERLTGVVSGKNGVQIYNTYGPTECTDHISVFALEDGIKYESIPIGRPLHNGQVFILNRNNLPVPEGCVGELCFSSVQLALGYYNNPELTAERFVDVTIGGKTVKIYRTGDLCRWNAAGQLEYIGRMDNQVKLRGYRIELCEIESAALRTEGVRQAVAMVKDERIVLYYTVGEGCEDLSGSDGTSGLESAIRRTLSACLPEYMLPSAYVRLGSMPLTPNGKIDRSSLPEPEYRSEVVVLPATVEERRVLDLVEDLLGLSPVSVTANLISLGLTSISAMRLSMRISKELGKGITMSRLLSAPTVRGIAGSLEESSDTGLGRVRERREYYLLTDNQLGVYLDWEHHREDLQYNIPYVLKLRGYDAERLKAAVETVLSAHPYLKTRLSVADGEVVLQRRDEDSFEIFVTGPVRLSSAPGTSFFQALVRPFDLFGKPLCRFGIYTYEDCAYLFCDIHHLITDGLSNARLVADILKVYNGGVVEPETFTAFDRALEEEEKKQTEAYKQAAGYYRELLSGLESTVYPHSSSASGQGRAGYVRQTLSGASVAGHCSILGVTVSNYLLTVFMEVLRRMTGEDRVLITAIDSGREHAAMHDIQGFFVKTLPVVSADTVVEVQSQLIESIRHECYPLTEMVQQFGIRPEIMYAFEGGLLDTASSDADLTDIDVTSLRLDTAKVPLTLLVNPEGKDYELTVEYDDSLYNEADMRVLLHSIIVLAQNYAERNAGWPGSPESGADVQLQECSMLTGEEEQSLIALGTGESLEYDRTKTFVDLFREQAASTPDAVAVVYKDKRLSYRELDALTDRLAVRLHFLGVAPEVSVGVLIDRSELMVVYPLAIMKAGGAYMPLDPSFPEDRLLYMCKDADITLILSDWGLADEVLPSYEGTVVDSSVIGTLPGIGDAGLSRLPNALPENKFVVLYTSGSTGKPKGVVLEHHSIVNFCHWYVKEYDMTSSDITIALARFGFDAHMMDLYPALVCGATVHIAPEEIRKDINALNEYMESNEVSIAFMTTQLGHLFASTIDNHSLRLLSVSGEKLMPLRKPPYRLYNAGAPTECTIYAFNYNITEEHYADPIIGRPIANVGIHLADRNLHLVPQGVPGEMIITGQGVGRGYLNLPEQNKERFITFLGQRAYRTGDLCRWNAEGQLEYVGRIDSQVKLRGYRIELGEIESAAVQVDGVGQAVASVLNDRLVLYYTPDGSGSGRMSGEGPSGSLDSEIRSSLSGVLPEYMVPVSYVEMETLPLTSNGKIDRRSLPEPEYRAEAVVLPSTDSESQVLAVVEKLLGVSPVSVTSNLITLGLTSISAMRLSMRLSRELGRSITMSALLESPTVRDIAGNLQDTSGSGLGRVRERREHYPLTANQLGVYLDWERHREGLQYNIPYVLKMDGYDAGRLKTSVEEVVACHPYLKSRLVRAEEGDKDFSPGEVVLQRRDEAVYECGITELDSEPGKDFFQNRVRPFDLFGDSLSRFEIYVWRGSAYLFCDIHHIITDGLSNARLVTEILKSYAGEEIEGETYTAFDRALEELEIRESESYSQAEEYYSGLLSGLEGTSYPHSVTGLGNGKAGYVRQLFGKTSVERRCASLGVTASNYLLTVFMEVLRRFTREDRVLITAVSGGREHAAMQDIQGFFVRTLPVVSAGSVVEVQEQLIKSIGHECYPLTEMAERMGFRPGIMYAYEGGLFGQYSDIRGREDIEVTSLNLDTVKVPLTLLVNPDGGQYELTVEYDDSLYDVEDMQTLLRSVVVLAENYAGSPVPLRDCSMLSAKEERGLIELGTGERLEYDRSKTFVDLFREQAARTPDAVAVVDGYGGLSGGCGSSLTYRELDEASDAIAWSLVKEGVGPETFVAVQLPRVKEFVSSVLGIMKAGAAYVPVDPDYPEERRRFIIKDSGAKAVITEEWLASRPSASPEAFVSRADVTGPAYMIYTSGSTGRPKGVINTQQGLMNYIPAVIKLLGLTASDRISLHRPFTFDAHLADLFPVLCAGASVYIMPEEIRHDVRRIGEYISGNGISGGSYTTSLGALLLDACRDLPLRYILLNGEKMSGLVSGDVQIFNGCGATECTDMMTMFRLERGVEYPDIPIGRPFANMYCFILDKYGHLLPRGARGELCYAGVQVAAGYCNLPEQTAQKFTVCPFVPGLRMYRSGDLCHWNEDGFLEHDGRIDSQVKLRGYRIEPGEIEGAAVQVEGVRQAVAMVRSDRIVLYYTAGEDLEESSPVVGASGLEAAIRDSLSAGLPEYMLPGAYVRLDSMPLTPNGKVDRNALPEPELLQEEYVAPANTKERMVCIAIATLLGQERLGVTDSFRACGLTSIKAMRLSMLLHKEGIDVNVGSILKADSVRNLCRNINDGLDGADIGSWFAEFDVAKPTIVLSCGLTGADLILRNVTSWTEKYNIYVLQPVFNAWSDMDDLSHEEIAERYFELIKRDIRGSVACIMGFSYGGELAYRLAAMWRDAFGEKPVVFMGDSYIEHRVPDEDTQRKEPVNGQYAYFRDFVEEFFSRRGNLPVADYDGKAVLISAERDSPHRDRNEQEWRHRNRDIRIVRADDTHQGLYENAGHYDGYLAMIDECLNLSL